MADIIRLAWHLNDVQACLPGGSRLFCESLVVVRQVSRADMEAGLPNPWVLGGDLPDLDTLPVVGRSHSDTLPMLDGNFDGNLPMLDTLPAVGSSPSDTSTIQ